MSDPNPVAFKPKKSVALSGVPAGNTALCSVGRSGNDLHYRGYDILDLAAHCEFEEVAYLLVHGKLPNAQELAGYLLWNCSHGCLIPPKDIILAVWDTWDLSVEELPWYLSREFGPDTVMSCIRELQAVSQGERRHRALDTLAYWTVGYDRDAAR